MIVVYAVDSLWIVKDFRIGAVGADCHIPVVPPAVSEVRVPARIHKGAAADDTDAGGPLDEVYPPPAAEFSDLLMFHLYLWS